MLVLVMVVLVITDGMVLVRTVGMSVGVEAMRRKAMKRAGATAFRGVVARIRKDAGV
jgi:hypothetical protein